MFAIIKGNTPSHNMVHLNIFTTRLKAILSPLPQVVLSVNLPFECAIQPSNVTGPIGPVSDFV